MNALYMLSKGLFLGRPVPTIGAWIWLWFLLSFFDVKTGCFYRWQKWIVWNRHLAQLQCLFSGSHSGTRNYTCLGDGFLWIRWTVHCNIFYFDFIRQIRLFKKSIYHECDKIWNKIFAHREYDLFEWVFTVFLSALVDDVREEFLWFIATSL